jgi:hypothetical protein
LVSSVDDAKAKLQQVHSILLNGFCCHDVVASKSSSRSQGSEEKETGKKTRGRDGGVTFWFPGKDLEKALEREECSSKLNPPSVVLCLGVTDISAPSLMDSRSYRSFMVLPLLLPGGSV